MAEPVEEFVDWMLKKPGSWSLLADATLAGGWEAYYAKLGEAAMPELFMAGGATAIAAGALPVVAEVGVFVALGAPYYQARQAARNENMTEGFSQGFVMGLLGWDWHHIVIHFGRHYFRQNEFDEAMDAIRVQAYNAGLKAGYAAAVGLPAAAKRAYLSKIRQASGVSIPGGWETRSDREEERLRARRVHINYVISLAAALQNHIIVPE